MEPLGILHRVLVLEGQGHGAIATWNRETMVSPDGICGDYSPKSLLGRNVRRNLVRYNDEWAREKLGRTRGLVTRVRERKTG